MADYKKSDLDNYPPPSEEQQGLTVVRDWTDEEERKAKRK
jgi:hypothetical protein